MNDDGIQLLSLALEVLFLVSAVIAVLVLWSNARARRTSKLKEAEALRSRADGVADERTGK